MVTPAERLRAAAERLAGLDKAATESPWSAGPSWAGNLGILGPLGQPVAIVSMSRPPETSHPDATLIAALRPLAPVIVKQLRDAATHAAETTETRGDSVWHHTDYCDTRVLRDGKRPEPPNFRCTCFDDALALADAILGGAR